MPSIALQQWATVRSRALDELEVAHRAVGGTGPGRRTATQQLNFSYALLLAAQFQGFCRDLHSESASHLGLSAGAPMLQVIYLRNLRTGRKLDTGNPNPGNLGADFDRLGLGFWLTVDAGHPRNAQRKTLLEQLNRWRNAIAHYSFAPDMYQGSRPSLPLADVQDWRKACDGLARTFDTVLRAHLLSVTGAAPW